MSAVYYVYSRPTGGVIVFFGRHVCVACENLTYIYVCHFDEDNICLGLCVIRHNVGLAVRNSQCKDRTFLSP